MSLPIIIQGGMGVGVSSWKLARKVSQLGQLGVVSGALISVVFARRLQQGDPDGSLRDALAHFPFRSVADRVLKEYFVEGGKAADASFASCPMPSLNASVRFLELTVCAAFSEVFLAKKGHDGKVGINLLEKLQLTTLPTLYGAMLAHVDVVLMGAGIPRSIPGILDLFAKGQGADIRIDVTGEKAGEETRMRFEPSSLAADHPPSLPRPSFLAIVSSSTLAVSLARKASGRVDGFVIESDLAGGHNAPPRGPLRVNDEGEPVYGDRDRPDLAVFRALGLPFWLAGNRATSEGLKTAFAEGARGVQLGTAFAFCSDSGMDDRLRREILDLVQRSETQVHTDPLASPTGFPFKVVRKEGTLSEADVYQSRRRICDLGHLRQAYRKSDGSIGYRCTAEPVENYVIKGGLAEDCVGRKCLCNGLCSTIGLSQIHEGRTEAELLTAGNDLLRIARFIKPGKHDYSCADIIGSLLAD